MNKKNKKHFSILKYVCEIIKMYKKDFNPLMPWAQASCLRGARPLFIIILYGTNQVFDVEIKPYLPFPSRFRACQKSLRTTSTT